MADVITNENKPMRNLLLSILITAIVFFLFGKSCSNPKDKIQTIIVPENQTSKPQLVKSDTVIKPVIQPKWQTITIVKTHVDSFFVSVPAVIDTLAILKKYFTEYAYSDTTKDSNIIIVNRYWVTQNKILPDSSHTWYKLLREKVVTNTVVAPNKIYLSVGMQIGFSKTSFLLSPELLLTDRKRRSYGLGYDIINQMYTGKIYIPLKLK